MEDLTLKQKIEWMDFWSKVKENNKEYQELKRTFDVMLKNTTKKCI